MKPRRSWTEAPCRPGLDDPRARWLGEDYEGRLTPEQERGEQLQARSELARQIAAENVLSGSHTVVEHHWSGQEPAPQVVLVDRPRQPIDWSLERGPDGEPLNQVEVVRWW